jgi:hypothetical protein
VGVFVVSVRNASTLDISMPGAGSRTFDGFERGMLVEIWST